MGPFIAVTSSPDEVAEIVRLVRELEGVEEVSDPTPLDASRALNAGLSPSDIVTALEMVKIAFETGAAMLVFLRALRDLLRERGGAAGVADVSSGAPLGRVDGETTDEDVGRLAPP